MDGQDLRLNSTLPHLKTSAHVYSPSLLLIFTYCTILSPVDSIMHTCWESDCVLNSYRQSAANFIESLNAHGRQWCKHFMNTNPCNSGMCHKSNWHWPVTAYTLSQKQTQTLETMQKRKRKKTPPVLGHGVNFARNSNKTVYFQRYTPNREVKSHELLHFRTLYVLLGV